MNNDYDDIKIIALKYIFILITILLVLIKGYNSIESIVVLLVYIINNQIRFFIFKNKGSLSLISYAIELVLACFMYSFNMNYAFIVFIPGFIDITINQKFILSIIYFVIAFMYSMTISSIIEVLPIIFCMVSIFILGTIVRNENEKKIKAQKLYDTIREREEELKEVNAELESYVSTVEEIAILRERNRISRELHDNVGHVLSTIMIQLGAIEKMILMNNQAAAKMAAELGKYTQEGLLHLREAVRDMKPREFEEYEGIIAISEMIKSFEKLSGIKVILRVSDKKWKLNADQTMVIYRLIQEFLSNSIRHGKATEIQVTLNFQNNNLRIHLKDNGIGCVNINEGIGLKSIKERIFVWGGSIEYFSEPNKGFELIAILEKGKFSIDGA